MSVVGNVIVNTFMTVIIMHNMTVIINVVKFKSCLTLNNTPTTIHNTMRAKIIANIGSTSNFFIYINVIEPLTI